MAGSRTESRKERGSLRIRAIVSGSSSRWYEASGKQRQRSVVLPERLGPVNMRAGKAPAASRSGFVRERGM
jgi:hypothetical protein